MRRRSFVSLASVVLLAGCTGDDQTDSPTKTEAPTNRPTDAPTATDAHTESDTPAETETETEPPTETEPQYDVTIDHTTTIQSGSSGEYNLPEQFNEGWSWLVMDLEVTDGDLNMEDVWFHAFYETEERLYAVAHDSSDVENGIEARGTVLEGGRGIILHDYPRSPQSDPVGWNTSVMDQSVGGENIIRDEPGEMYPSVTVEYSAETVKDPDILPNDANRRLDDSETWAIITIEVTEGYLNMENVWFRSRLTAGSRRYELSHASSRADRGILSRGFVKPGSTAHALFAIPESESVGEWGYTENSRQDVTINRG